MTKGSEGKEKTGREAEAIAGPAVREKESEGTQDEGPRPDQQDGLQETAASEADSAGAEVSPEERVEELVKENEELQDKFVRLMADFDNFRKRAGKEKSDIIRFGNEGLLKDILPIVDNIERLLTYSYQESGWKSFQEGIELLLAETGKTLGSYGVEPIEALGKAFDPNLHEAMQRAETTEVAANTVVEVYQKGYVYRGKLLRPSLVVVAVPPKGEEQAEGEKDAEKAEEPDGGKGRGKDKGEDEEQPVN